MWVFAVNGLMTMCAAISSFVSPRAASPVTSCSRRVSVSKPVGVERSGGRDTNSPIRRRVMDGDSSASPRAATRTAWRSSTGSVSLSRNPAAPARSASKTYSSRP